MLRHKRITPGRTIQVSNSAFGYWFVPSDLGIPTLRFWNCWGAAFSFLEFVESKIRIFNGRGGAQQGTAGRCVARPGLASGSVTGVCEKHIPVARAFALQPGGRNFSPAPDMMLWLGRSGARRGDEGWGGSGAGRRGVVRHLPLRFPHEENCTGGVEGATIYGGSFFA